MFLLSFIESVLKEKKNGFGNTPATGFCVNSKKIKEGDCFIALQGEQVDGSLFFKEAILKGAVGVILNEAYSAEFLKIQDEFHGVWAFFVKDTKEALHALAAAWRRQFQIPFIAVTGSMGKTTTKELLKSIFEKQGYRVFATQNSENGSVGLPLNILKLRPSHTIAIFEMGIEKIGEMDVLCQIIGYVSVAIITTIIESHFRYFESIDAVIKEKIKIEKIAKDLICIDAEFKRYVKVAVPVIGFGTKESSDIVYSSLSTKVVIDIDNKKYSINTPYHEGFHHCLVAAFIVASFLKIRPQAIIDAIESFKKINGRFSIHHLKSGGIVINDAYNAVNPLVMLKSLEAFEGFSTHKKKIVVFGDMFDLGSLKETAHGIILERAAHISEDIIEKFYFFGDAFFAQRNKCYKDNIIFVETFQEIEKEIFGFLDRKYCLLFKASNGTGLFKRVVSYLEEQEV